MALMDELRTKLTAIADAIRGKTGSSETLTMDEMVTAINGISTSGSGGGGSSGGSSYDGMYTINFYDVDKNFIESHSAIYGFWIDKPLSYTADGWHNLDGHLNQFPLTVTTEEAGGKPNVTYDLYASSNGTNMFYVIDPNGTDFNSTFFSRIGTPQSGSKSLSGYNGRENYDTTYAYKLEVLGNGHNYSYALNDPIICSQYKWFKIKYYVYYPYSGWGAGNADIYLAKDLTNDGYGNTSNYYDRLHITNYNSTTLEGDVLTNPDNVAWKWATFDVSNIDKFYLNIREYNFGLFIAEAYLTM